MTDAVAVAKARREDYQNAITDKEAEIAELKELVGDLDSFIEFGEALVTDADGAVETKSEEPSVELKEVPNTPVTPKIDNDHEPVSEWDTVENSQGIASVLETRTAS